MGIANILSVDDDENLQFVIKEYLEDEGHTVFTAANRNELLDILEKETIDIVLQDLVIPNDDGLSMISAIREKSEAFIFIVSGKDDPLDKIIGLEVGADDYITKPFEMRELNARIKATMRRFKQQKETAAAETEDEGPSKITLPHWVLDRSRFQLFDTAGKSMNLTTGEFQLLEALALAPNRVLSREHLFSITRDGKFDVYDRAIDIQIGRIRKKMNDDPNDPQHIKTVRGVGYMLVV
ncbi:MAG: DNA-binding response regulator [Micavibrio sp.]|nr:DNA-binding response regulator [Micavibrio sp.]